MIGTYPVPTTTFIDREIDALRRLGAEVHVISIRRPPSSGLSERLDLIRRSVSYVLPATTADLLRSHVGFLVSRPAVYLGTIFRLASRPHPNFRSRMRTVLHFGVGVRVARLIRDRFPTDHVHAHFIDRAAVVALVAGRLLDRSFSATAHANDIYVGPVLLPEKISSAKFIATCTGYNRAHLRSLANGASDKIRCIHHGLDLDGFRPSPTRRSHPPLILSVGQLKEKKGFDHLLVACSLLRERGVAFACEIVGDGPLRHELAGRIDELHLGSTVRLTGACPYEEVLDRYREATVFVLPCVTASDGDRDGIPNVILEAMAMGLPVVSTRHSGIPEAVEDGRTGSLVPPGDPVALADAIAAMIDDEELQERFGRLGRERIAALFDVDVNARALLAEVTA